LEDPSVNERIILKFTSKKWDARHAVDRSGSVEGQAVVNAVMNLLIPLNAGKFLTS
jgi:hypothetical protein